MHLVTLHKQVKNYRPQIFIVDPISTFLGAGSSAEAESMLMRLIDYLKAEQVTAVFTSLTYGGDALERSQVGISSLIDTWLLVRDIELGGERNRAICVLKSRGMAHSNQIREFLLTDHGVELRDVYVGPEGVLTGSMRLAQEARERNSALIRREDVERRQRALERKRRALEAQIDAQRAQFEAEQDELRLLITQGQAAADIEQRDRDDMARSRKADAPAGTPNNRPRKPAPQGGRKS
jgi:circadian clock protein KaiC